MTTLQSLLTQLPTPDNTYRPVQIIHCYYPKTPAEVEAYLAVAKENGIGGFCVNVDCVPARLPEETEEAYKIRRLDGYLGEGTPETEAAWASLASFIDACFAAGFYVWIYDELAYPSGAAGHWVLKNLPDCQVKGAVCATAVVNGGKGEVPGEEGTLLSAGAYPILEDGTLSTRDMLPVVAKDGVIAYDLPTGEYRICAVYQKPVAFLTENKVPYVDLMRADVVDRFIDVTHGAYLRHLGAERIAKIVAFFTDEPGLPTHGCSSYFYEKNAVVAWTEEIEKRLPSVKERYVDLFFRTDRDYASLRRLYWDTVATLFGQNYFGRIAAWCEKHSTRMTGHLYGEETLSMQIGLNGDLFGLMRYMQMPGVDRLYCVNPRDVTAEKTASSAAHLYGCPYTMSENSFHLEYNFWKIKDQATDENRLNSHYYQAQLGISHAASYFGNPAGVDVARRTYEERAARASLFCATGVHKADVLVLIPMGAAYERFMPPDHKYWNVGPCTVAPHQDKSVQVIEEAYGETLRRLQDGRLDFDLIDEVGLLSCNIAEGKIATPHERFTHLVLFDTGRYPAQLVDKIRECLTAGITVTAVRTDMPSPDIATLAESFDTVRFASHDEIVYAVLEGHAAPVLNVVDLAPNVRVRRTETADADLWFVHNRGDACSIDIQEKGQFTVFAVEDGSAEVVNSIWAFRLDLPEKSARMLVREK